VPFVISNYLNAFRTNGKARKGKTLDPDIMIKIGSPKQSSNIAGLSLMSHLFVVLVAANQKKYL
jgi:hypothetical protein